MPSLLPLAFVLLVPDVFTQATVVKTFAKTVGSGIVVVAGNIIIITECMQFWRDHLITAVIARFI